MNDTSVEMSRKMSEMIQKKLPLERLKMGSSMYDMSKRLVIQTLLKNNPYLSTADLRQEIFQKFYGNDFTPETAEKIKEHLRKVSKSEENNAKKIKF